MSEFAIPDCWKVVELGEVSFVTKLAGFEYTDYFDYSIGGEIIAVRCLNIRNGRLCLDAVQTIPRSVSNKLPRSKLQRGDLVISYVGTIGEVAAIPSNNRFHLAPNVARVVLEPEHVDSSFVVQQMLADDCQNRISLLTASTTQAAISMTRLRTLKLITPPLPEQRKIARILTTLDNLIEKTEALIAKYQSIKQGMMHDLFTRGVDAHGRLRPTHEQAPDLYKQLGRVRYPKCWQVCPLSDHADVSGGVTLGRKLDSKLTVALPYLRVANVQDGYLDLTEMKNVEVLASEAHRYELKPNDVVMTEGGDFDKLGRGTIWEGQITPCLHQNHVFRVRATGDELNPRFLAHLTASFYGRHYFLMCAKQTTNLASINATQVKAFPLLLPTREEQDAIVERADAIDQQIRNEQSQVQKHQQTKSGLMQDLLTGKVRVNVE